MSTPLRDGSASKKPKIASRSFESRCIEATFDVISSPGDFVEWCKLHQVDREHGQVALGKFLTSLNLATKGHGWITALPSSGEVIDFVRSLKDAQAQDLLSTWIKGVSLWATYNTTPSS